MVQTSQMVQQSSRNVTEMRKRVRLRTGRSKDLETTKRRWTTGDKVRNDDAMRCSRIPGYGECCAVRCIGASRRGRARVVYAHGCESRNLAQLPVKAGDLVEGVQDKEGREMYWSCSKLDVLVLYQWVREDSVNTAVEACSLLERRCDGRYR